MRFATSLKWPAALALLLFLAIGCANTEEHGSQPSVDSYYGVGYADPFYYGGTYYPPDVVVTPPPRPVEPPHPEHPIALPPAASNPTPQPLPSIPSAPRVAPRR